MLNHLQNFNHLLKFIFKESLKIQPNCQKYISLKYPFALDLSHYLKDIQKISL